MAISCVAGSFTQQAGTGAQVVTTNALGVAVIFSISDSLLGDGSYTDRFATTHGMATAGVTQASICATAGASWARTQQTNTACIHIIDEAGATAARATFTSFTGSEFTINWVTNDSIARIINYILICGATGAIILTGQVGAAPGVANYIGAGFQPEFIHTLTSSNATAAVASFNTFCVLDLGIASATTAEAASGFDIDTGPGFEKVQVSDACVISTDSVGAVYNRGNLSAFTADGFDIDWTTASDQSYFFALCLAGGGSYKVGSFNQATSVGAQAVTGIGHEPEGVMFISQNNASSTSVITTNTRRTVGFGVTSAQRGATWSGASGTSWNCALATNQCILHYSEGTPTLNAAADLSSLTSDTINLSWSTADGTARQILYASFGNTAAAAYDPANDNSWHNYTVGPRRRLVEVIGT